jgi:DNA-binding beta-propeller fold protein YncE
VTWTASDTTVASISNAPGSNGLATTAGVGSTSISASLGNVTSSAVTLTAATEYAFVANTADSLSQFTIGAGGALTQTYGVAALPHPDSVTVDPTGRYVYVVSNPYNAISLYTIGTGGALTSIGTVATGSHPRCVAIDPTGRYVYASGGNTVSQYTIGTGGAFTSFGPVGTGGGPVSITTTF